MLAEVFAAYLLLQQAEEDSGGFRTGDVALRPYVAVFIAYNISKMIAAVEQSGNLCRRGFAGIVVFVIFFVIFFVVILVLVFVFAAAAVVLFAKDIGVGYIAADTVFFGIWCHIPMTGGIFIACGRNHNGGNMACIQCAACRTICLRMQYNGNRFILCGIARPIAVYDFEGDGGIFCPVCINGCRTIEGLGFKINGFFGGIFFTVIPSKEGVAFPCGGTQGINLVFVCRYGDIAFGRFAFLKLPLAAVGIKGNNGPPLCHEIQVRLYRHILNCLTGVEGACCGILRIGCRLVLCILLLSLCILLLFLCIEERCFIIIPPTLEVVGVRKLCDGCGNGILFLGKCRAVRNGIAY